MDYIDASCIEFLDLSDVEESEKLWIQKSLASWNSNVEGPWNRTPLDDTNANCQKTSNPGQVVATTKINVPENYAPTQVYQQVQPYSPPYEAPQNQYYGVQTSPPQYSHPVVQVPPENSIAYHSPNPPQINPNTVVDINYAIDDKNIKTCLNTKLQISEPQYCPPPVKNGGGGVYLNGHTSSESKPVEEEKVVENEPTDTNKSSSKSWASLFNKSKSQVTSTVPEPKKPLLATISPFTNTDKQNEVIPSNRKNELAHLDDPNYYRMGEFLLTHTVDNRVTSLQPRGLINRSNYCYINSILQALLACPPIYNLLIGLASSVSTTEKRKWTPIVDNMAQFVKEFHHLPATLRVGRRTEKNQRKEQASITCEPPFEPFWIYKMLSGKRSDSFVIEGRQEDAEEFLGCLLNGLNDEMLELLKLAGKQSEVTIQQETILEIEDKEWQVMGPKNKGCVTRRTEIVKTPISDIFGGQLRSRIHRAGDLSTDNIQPFFTLQLNIENVSSVRDALEALVCKNQLEGVTSSKTNEEVEAWQQVTIEELPIILIMHLKCFNFKPDGCTKIIKPIDFPIDLKVDSKLLSSKTNYSPKEKQYKLFAVVYHDGKEVTKGHYITDAYHVGYASWLRYDDASVKPVLEEQVLKPHGSRVPYLLFYRRSDSVRK